MVNWSVEHWVAGVTIKPGEPETVGSPNRVVPMVVVTVFGPAMTNVLKSTRSWK